MHNRLFFAVFLLWLVAVASGPVHASPIDSNFFTTYSLDSENKNVSWMVSSGSGISGSGTLGPFVRVGAMLEGAPVQNVKKGTVTRDIYIVDAAYGPFGDDVALYVYQKVDKPNGLDSVTITFSKVVDLFLTGGSAASISMAADKDYLYVGSNQFEAAAQVVKKGTFFLGFAGGSSGLTISSITSDQYGYVTITSGSGPAGSFTVYSPSGQAQEAGVGAMFTLNAVQGVLLPTP